MKCERLGNIFDVKKYGFEYAKSPQAVVFEDFVRVYFSDCKKDNDKLISYVCFADFTKDFRNVIKIKRQILPDGELGCFDEHGIFPFSPFVNDGKIWGYTSGWSRRKSVSVDTGIGLVVSDDNGESFYRLGNGPVLTSSLYEPFLVVDGFVKKYNDKYHMWYIFGTEWKIFKEGEVPERIYKIGHAVSDDGIEWKRDGRQIISDKIEDESQALPSVMYHNGCYYMVFCYRNSYDFRNNSKNSYSLGYAISYDLINWERCDESCFEGERQEWESDMNCYPNLCMVNDQPYILYNGNGFGKTGFGIMKVEL